MHSLISNYVHHHRPISCQCSPRTGHSPCPRTGAGVRVPPDHLPCVRASLVIAGGNETSLANPLPRPIARQSAPPSAHTQNSSQQAEEREPGIRAQGGGILPRRRPPTATESAANRRSNRRPRVLLSLVNSGTRQLWHSSSQCSKKCN